MYCSNCRYLIPQGSAFCPNCGQEAPTQIMNAVPTPPHQTQYTEQSQGYGQQPYGAPSPNNNNRALVIIAIVIAAVVGLFIVIGGFYLAGKDDENQTPVATTQPNQTTQPDTSQQQELEAEKARAEEARKASNRAKARAERAKKEADKRAQESQKPSTPSKPSNSTASIPSVNSIDPNLLYNYPNFQTPSGNIHCTTGDDYLRCDVGNIDSPASKPASCDLDYGHAFQLPQFGSASRLCHGDTVTMSDNPILGYGQLSNYKGFSCYSTSSNLACKSDSGGGTMILSKQSQTLR